MNTTNSTTNPIVKQVISKSNKSVLIPNTDKQTTTHKGSAGKFITAKPNKVLVNGASENFKDHKYSLLAKRKYNNLPKNMKHITASISYCKHTGTKLVMGTSFSNCAELTNFIPSQHPLFEDSFPLATAIKVYGRSKTATERYIAMTAILVKTKIINTSESGVHLNSPQVDKLQPSFEVLLAVLNSAMKFPFNVAIDSLLVDSEIAVNVGRIKQQIQDCTQVIDSAVFAAGGSKFLQADEKLAKTLRLEDEIELERELAKVLTGYKDSQGTKYTPALNRWTRRALNRSDMTDEQITVTMKILNTSPDQIRSNVIESILPTVRESLCSEDEISRRNSALVVRHLEYKIELQLACLYKAGFVSDILEEDIRNDKALTSYTTKTKAVEDKAIAKIAVKSSGALAMLRKRMGVK